MAPTTGIPAPATTTAADGIEDHAQQRQLERLGCTRGQGFLFSRPQPPSMFADVLRAGLVLTPAAEPTAR